MFEVVFNGGHRHFIMLFLIVFIPLFIWARLPKYDFVSLVYLSVQTETAPGRVIHMSKVDTKIFAFDYTYRVGGKEMRGRSYLNYHSEYDDTRGKFVIGEDVGVIYDLDRPERSKIQGAQAAPLSLVKEGWGLLFLPGILGFFGFFQFRTVFRDLHLLKSADFATGNLDEIVLTDGSTIPKEYTMKITLDNRHLVVVGHRDLPPGPIAMLVPANPNTEALPLACLFADLELGEERELVWSPDYAQRFPAAIAITANAIGVVYAVVGVFLQLA